jgi:peptidoglycan/LPS O-acetylase OafA/YrhL
VNEEKPTVQFFEKYLGSIASGIVIAMMLAGLLTFFAKMASYPDGSQLQTDYGLAGFVFLFVFIYASARVAGDWVIGSFFAFGLALVGIMSIFASQLTAYEKNGQTVIRLEPLILPFGAALILIALLISGRLFIEWTDAKLEGVDQNMKRKNDELKAAQGRLIGTRLELAAEIPVDEPEQQLKGVSR